MLRFTRLNDFYYQKKNLKERNVYIDIHLMILIILQHSQECKQITKRKCKWWKKSDIIYVF